MRFWATTAVLLVFASPAFGQLRTIPQQAKRGQMSHLQGMVVEIDGTRVRLSPGAQIRDPDNRLVLPVSLPPNSEVRYVADDSGAIHRVWILTAQEKAHVEKKPEAQPLKK
jgi:hypothetical protein